MSAGMKLNHEKGGATSHDTDAKSKAGVKPRALRLRLNSATSGYVILPQTPLL
jgi:hypothetical protein